MDHDEAISVVRQIKPTLLAFDDVIHVSLGLADNGHGELDYAIWVRLSGDGDEARQQPEVELPLCFFEPETFEGVESNPTLNQRANPPIGGYNIGPNSTKVGSLGVMGFMHEAEPDNLAMATAAHVFKNPNGTYYPIARQPHSMSQNDIISAYGPVETLDEYDVVVWHMNLNARNWDTYTKVAFIGTISSTNLVEAGQKVSKTGRSTGRTSGTLRAEKYPFWSVTPANPNQPISDHGDSGAAWICTDDSDDLSWVGILLGQPPSGENRSILLDANFIATSSGFSIWNLG